MKSYLLTSILILTTLSLCPSPRTSLCPVGRFNPVCGKNNITYNNNCLCQRANIQIAYRGRCRQRYINKKFFGGCVGGRKFVNVGHHHLNNFYKRRNHCNYAGPCNDYNRDY